MKEIWFIGYRGEKTFDYFCKVASKSSLRFGILDLDLLAEASKASVLLTSKGLELTLDSEVFRIGNDSVVFQRMFLRQLANAAHSKLLLEFISAFDAWSARAEAMVVNPIASGGQNRNKLEHILRLRELGFKIPDTIASNCGLIASNSINPDHRWISKGCSSIRTSVETVDKSSFGNIDSLAVCPSQFQTKVDGNDVRVHLVGKRHVSVRISTDADDYRYASKDGFEVEYSETVCPDHILVLAREYARREKLPFAGFDFRVSNDDWVVLECNPMPGFDFYDRVLDEKISQLLIEYLSASATRRSGDGSVSFPALSPDSKTFISPSRRPKTNHS